MAHWKLSVPLRLFSQANVSKLRRPLDTGFEKKLPDSRERTGPPVLWLSCEGRVDVLELFSNNFFLSAIINQQGLSVSAPIDFGTKKAGSFSPQLLQCFWFELKKKNTKNVGMSPTVSTKSLKQKEMVWQQYHFVFVRSRASKPRRKTLLYFGTRVKEGLGG